MLVANFFHPRVGEPNRVDHAALELCHARCARAVAPLDAHGLGNESAEFFDVDYSRQLSAIGGSARGQQNRILKVDPRGVDGERGRCHRYRWPPTRDS